VTCSGVNFQAFNYNISCNICDRRIFYFGNLSHQGQHDHNVLIDSDWFALSVVHPGSSKPLIFGAIVEARNSRCDPGNFYTSILVAKRFSINENMAVLQNFGF